MKKISLILFVAFVGFSTNAQTADELKKEQASKKAQITKLQGEVDAIQSKIDALPGWRKGAFGTIGGNISGFNNWFSKATPNSSAGNIGITFNGFAHLIEDKFFWRNSLNVNLAWVKLDDKDSTTDSDSFESASDVFNISSLYGRKLNTKWAVSGLGEYRTTLIDNFNNPGFLDIGVGATWTPLDNLVVVIHPGNYNFVFSSGDNDTFSSSLGAKIVADYATAIKGVNLKSNLSMFQSYKSGNLSNWTWTNSLGYTLWKGIGIGFELGLRKNKQEALNNAIALNPPVSSSIPTFNSIDNKLQSYWLFGVNYSF